MTWPKFKTPLLLTNRLFVTLLSASVILIGSYLAIQYAKGNYRLTNDGVLPESGLLSANSFPPGAQIFVNDKLVSATDDTLYLEPAEYQVKIVKEGYSPWLKTLKIQKELVAQTNAQLFPAVPTITPLTFTGAQNPLPSPDGRKIIYYTASASASLKNGVYLLELSDNNFNPFQKNSKQIIAEEKGYNLKEAHYIWSPDSSQLIVITPQKQVLIDFNKTYQLSSLADISFKRKQILGQWEEEMYLRERQYLADFPPEVINIATQSAKNVYISPDKKRLLYTATASATLPEGLVPPIPARSSQPEERQLEPGKIYVYDREEDRNFALAKETGEPTVVKSTLATDLDQPKPASYTASPSAFTRLQHEDIALTVQNFNAYHTSLFINTLQWFTDSKHLLFVQDGRIQIIEYDGTNNTTLYSGPFGDGFIYPWPNGTRLIMLTTFSPDYPNNLYAIELK